MGIVERMLSASGITEQSFMDSYHRQNQVSYGTTRVKTKNLQRVLGFTLPFTPIPNELSGLRVRQRAGKNSALL